MNYNSSSQLEEVPLVLATVGIPIEIISTDSTKHDVPMIFSTSTVVDFALAVS